MELIDALDPAKDLDFPVPVSDAPDAELVVPRTLASLSVIDSSAS